MSHRWYVNRYGPQVAVVGPNPPVPVEPPQERQVRRHGKTVVQQLLRCPDCLHEWWHTTSKKPNYEL